MSASSPLLTQLAERGQTDSLREAESARGGARTYYGHIARTHAIAFRLWLVWGQSSESRKLGKGVTHASVSWKLGLYTSHVGMPFGLPFGTR